MTEQQPSAEAMKLASRHADGEVKKCAAEIDALIAQRVAAETERWQNRDCQRLEQIDRLQETVQSLQSARDERPAPPQRHLTGGEREVLHKALLASSTLVHSGDAKQTRPSDLTQDYTERAREIVRKYIKLGVKFVVGPNVYAEWMKNDIADALSAVASELRRSPIRPEQQTRRS